MSTKNWLDASDNWNTAADWSGGTVPGSGDDVIVAQGAPQVTAPIDVASITNSAAIGFSSPSGQNSSSNVSGDVNNTGTISLSFSGGEVGGLVVGAKLT